MRAILTAVAIAFAAFPYASVLLAHDAPTGWKYPWACCANQDCKQMTGQIAEVREGYIVLPTSEIVPYADKRVKDSPDGEYHWCRHLAGVDKGRTICLFVPPKGM